MTRRQAIRAFYLWLHGGSKKSVRECPMTGHPLWPYRTGKLQVTTRIDADRHPDVRTGKDYRYDQAMQQAKAIRTCCLGCRENVAEVRRCPHTNCQLYEYRLGRPSKPKNAPVVPDSDTTDS